MGDRSWPQPPVVWPLNCQSFDFQENDTVYKTDILEILLLYIRAEDKQLGNSATSSVFCAVPGTKLKGV